MHNLKRNEIDLIAFPGHTIFHDPENSITRQIGSPEIIENMTKIRTIGHFRKYDVDLGGQVDKFVEALNHGAEEAAKEAKPIFVAAIHD